MSGNEERPGAGVDGEVFDVVVIGSGFGGAVTARRLAEADIPAGTLPDGRRKLRVLLLERGRRYGHGDFPRLPRWRGDGQHPVPKPAKGHREALRIGDAARWLWPVDLGLFAPRDLGSVIAVQAAGYGGGSLIYANVHMRPGPEVFEGWNVKLPDLEPFFDRFERDLRPSPVPSLPDRAIRFREAASALERGEQFFRPHLAIDHETCEDCSHCDVGCPCPQIGPHPRAKLSMDRTFLPAAEAIEEGDARCVTVRTLCEVTRVDALEAGDEAADKAGAPRYRIVYRDRLRGSPGSPGRAGTVEARAVFLCAGAVNTAELLMRSKKTLPGMTHAHLLGERFFTNHDDFAFVHDAKRSGSPWEAPVITTALVHDQEVDVEGQKRRIWTMIQDGGYPEALWFVGNLFRSGLFGRRNARTTATSAVVPGPKTLRPFAELLSELDWQLRGDGKGPRPHDPEFWKLLPADVQNLLSQLHDRWKGFAQRETRALFYDVLRLCADDLANQVAERVAGDIALVPILRPFEDDIRKLIVKAAKPIFEGATEEIPEEGKVLKAIRDRYMYRRTADPPEPNHEGSLEPMLRHVVDGLLLPDVCAPGAAEHGALFLVMGRDLAPGQLHIGRFGMEARWDRFANRPLGAVQERLLQDLAGQMKGELRLNPTHVFGDRFPTSHPQGGCPLPHVDEKGKPSEGFVDDFGEVRGLPGLRVSDGSLIPHALGVNPAHTIAALAERNVAHFLKDRYAVPLPDGAHGPAEAPPEPVPDGRLPPARLSPPACADSCPQPRSETLGLTFDEVLEGELPAPGRGGPAGRIRLDLTVSVTDLVRFFADDRRRMDVTGTVTLAWPDAEARPIPATGYLDVLRPLEGDPETANPGERAPGGDGAREMVYALRLLDDYNDLTLAARKVARDDPGFDMVRDLTRAGYTLEGRVDVGGDWQAINVSDVLRVPLGRFLGDQVPSMKVTGVDDVATCGWYMAEFMALFGVSAARPYAPRFDALLALLERFGVNGPRRKKGASHGEA